MIHTEIQEKRKALLRGDFEFDRRFQERMEPIPKVETRFVDLGKAKELKFWRATTKRIGPMMGKIELPKVGNATIIIEVVRKVDKGA